MGISSLPFSLFPLVRKPSFSKVLIHIKYYINFVSCTGITCPNYHGLIHQCSYSPVLQAFLTAPPPLQSVLHSSIDNSSKAWRSEFISNLAVVCNGFYLWQIQGHNKLVSFVIQTEKKCEEKEVYRSSDLYT